MVCITSIATHDNLRVRRMGLVRALLTRRANLGDCADATSVLRHLASPALLRRPACIVPVPSRWRADASSFDLALAVARRTLNAQPDLAPGSVAALILCHTAPDASTTDSTAGHLQFDLGLPRACAFSISQAHTAELPTALDLAAGLIEGPERAEAVLVVAADKLVFGASPHPRHHLAWCDVAAAALLTRESRTGWRVDALDLGHDANGRGAASVRSPADSSTAIGRTAETIATHLASAGVAPRDLAAVFAVSGDPGFDTRVHRAAGLDLIAARVGSGTRQRFTASADLLVGLAALEDRIRPGQRVLAWCHGSNGEFACLLMTRTG